MAGAAAWLALAAAAIALVTVPAPAAQSVSALVPDPEAFYRETRANLERSQREQIAFAYKERRTELAANPFGRLGTTGDTTAWEVTPEADGAAVVRRLIERNGTAVTGGPVERVMRRREPDGSAGRPRPSGWEDAVSALRFHLDRREVRDGRSLIVVLFEPRPDARPVTREGRLARVFKGRILVDEERREVARVEAIAIDDISLGFGLVARLGEGTTVTLTRERVDGGTWLPTSIRFDGEGRALLFRKLTVHHVIEWFDYRRLWHPAA